MRLCQVLRQKVRMFLCRSTFHEYANVRVLRPLSPYARQSQSASEYARQSRSEAKSMYLRKRVAICFDGQVCLYWGRAVEAVGVGLMFRRETCGDGAVRGT